MTAAEALATGPTGAAAATVMSVVVAATAVTATAWLASEAAAAAAAQTQMGRAPSLAQNASLDPQRAASSRPHEEAMAAAALPSAVSEEAPRGRPASGAWTALPLWPGGVAPANKPGTYT